jgi:hypothetical protein
MARRKGKFGSAVMKKFFQNDAGSYFDYMMNNIADVVDDVQTTNQPEEFDALIISEEIIKIRNKVKGTDKKYPSFYIRFIDENYGTDTSALPDPFQVSSMEDYKRRLQYHPSAVAMEEGVADQLKFGATVTVKKQEGTWVINKYVLDTSESYEEFIIRIGEKEENIKKSQFKPPPTETPEVDPDTEEGAKNYDEDKTIPIKTQHSPYIAELNPTMQPMVKHFIYEVWKQLKVEIYFNSGYRSPAHQKKLKDDYDNGDAKYKKDHAKPADPPVFKTGKWSGGSRHNVGLAIDVNATLSKTGVTLGKRSPSDPAINKKLWIDSKVVAIAESTGLRWGGHYFGNFDPVHFELKASSVENILNIATEKNIAANKVDLSSFMPKKGKETKSAGNNNASAPTKIRPDQSIGVGAGPQYMQQYTNMVPDTLKPTEDMSEQEFLDAGGTLEAWEEYTMAKLSKTLGF